MGWGLAGEGASVTAWTAPTSLQAKEDNLQLVPLDPMTIKLSLCLGGSGGDWSLSIVRCSLALRPCDSESYGWILGYDKRGPCASCRANRAGVGAEAVWEEGSCRPELPPKVFSPYRSPTRDGPEEEAPVGWAPTFRPARTRFPVEPLGVPNGDSWPPLLRDPGGERVEEGWGVGFFRRLRL